MPHALIHKATQRLCEVRLREFPVHAEMEWRECADEVTPETHDFDGSAFLLKPPPPPPPTPEELEAICRGIFDTDKLFRAKCVSDLAFRLGKAPGALTAAELLAERNRIAAIYKVL